LPPEGEGRRGEEGDNAPRTDKPLTEDSVSAPDIKSGLNALITSSRGSNFLDPEKNRILSKLKCPDGPGILAENVQSWEGQEESTPHHELFPAQGKRRGSKARGGSERFVFFWGSEQRGGDESNRKQV